MTMSKQKFFINEDELDNFQIQLLQKRIDRSMIVSGCAGSGKSILALWKAKQIKENPQGGTYKFIVFTKSLNRYMADGIRSIGLDNENFTYFEDWKRQGYPKADFIIVDEIQDFDKDEISKFKQAATKAFFFWGDSAQSLYGGLKKTQTIMEISADEKLQADQLYFNHRLPKKIAKIAAYIGQDHELVGKCQKEGAELPRIIQYQSIDDQLDATMEIMKNRKITDAGILLPSGKMVQRAYEYLSQQGLNVEAKYEDKANYRNSRFDLDFSSNNPKIMTYHSAKGLQFEAVFLPECNVHYNDARASLYVAITRSYQYLYVMYSKTLSPFFDTVPNNLYETTIEGQRIEI